MRERENEKLANIRGEKEREIWCLSIFNFGRKNSMGIKKSGRMKNKGKYLKRAYTYIHNFTHTYICMIEYVRNFNALKKII